MSDARTTEIDMLSPQPPRLSEDESLLYLIKRFKENLRLTPEEEALANRLLDPPSEGQNNEQPK